MQPYRPFSAYRPHDYRIPRSMRETYGKDVDLYVAPVRPSHSKYDWLGWVILIAIAGLNIWLAYGWF